MYDILSFSLEESVGRVVVEHEVCCLGRLLQLFTTARKIEAARPRDLDENSDPRIELIRYWINAPARYNEQEWVSTVEIIESG